MNCEKCAWFVRRELTEAEVQMLKQHPNLIIDTRFCTLNGCDGSRFIPNKAERKDE